MSRPRTPTAVLDARGAFEKNPQRKRVNEPKPTALVGDAPEHLTEFERQMWDELKSNAPTGVFTNFDRATLELASRLMARSRLEFDTFPASQMSLLIKLLGSFGMNPSDRSKVVVPQEKQKDEWDDF